MPPSHEDAHPMHEERGPQKIRVAVVQLQGHASLTTGAVNFASEPFLSSKSPPCLATLAAHGFQVRDLQSLCRSKYEAWHKSRVFSILQWLKRLPESEMPHVLVFAEGGMPRPCLVGLSEWAAITRTVVFAGTHAIEATEDAIDDYVEADRTHRSSKMRKIPPDKSGSGRIRGKFQQMVGENLGSSVLPIIDSDGSIRYIPKTYLSPFERTGTALSSEHTSPDQRTAIPVHLRSEYGAQSHSSKRKRGISERETLVLPLICSEALQTRNFDQGPVDLAVICSHDPTPAHFQSILNHFSDNQVPVIYCNDGQFGGSMISTQFDERGENWWFLPPTNGVLPEGDAILIMEVTSGGNATGVGVSNAPQNTTLLKISSVVPDNDQYLDTHVSHALHRLHKGRGMAMVDQRALIERLMTLLELSDRDPDRAARLQKLRADVLTSSRARHRVLLSDVDELLVRSAPHSMQRIELLCVRELALAKRDRGAAPVTPGYKMLIREIDVMLGTTDEEASKDEHAKLQQLKELALGTRGRGVAVTVGHKALIRELDELLERGEPNSIQRIKLERLRELSLARNGDPGWWSLLGVDCYAVKHTEADLRGMIPPMALGRKPYGASTPERGKLDWFQSFQALERELTWECYKRIIHILNSQKMSRGSADVLVNLRDECCARLGIQFGTSARLGANRFLKKIESAALATARRNLSRNLGTLVEHHNATSGWIFLRRNRVNPASTSDPVMKGDLTMEAVLITEVLHNTPVQQFERGIDPCSEGIVGHVAATKAGYVRNNIHGGARPRRDPLYKPLIQTTRSELAVPILAKKPGNGLNVGDVLAVVNLESNQANAFLPMQVGELQAAVAQLLPDIELLHAYHQLNRTAIPWHPQAQHGWQINTLLDRFCEAVASSLPHATREPLISCTVWHVDRAKQCMYARGTARFDFEYIAEQILPFVPPEKDKPADSSDGEAQSFMGWVANMPRGKVERRLWKVSAHFKRRFKAERMELRKMIATPIFLRDEESAGNAVGVLALYFYEFDHGIDGVDTENVFSDAEVVRLADIVGNLVTDVRDARKGAIVSSLYAEVTTQTITPPGAFAALKSLLSKAFDSDGCSIFGRLEAANPPLYDVLELINTTGVSAGNGIRLQGPDPSAILAYRENFAERQFFLETPTGGSPVYYDLTSLPPVGSAPYTGVTSFLAQHPGAVVRKIDIHAQDEPCQWKQDQGELCVHPSDRYREVLADSETDHRRFLGGSASAPAPDCQRSTGVVRMVRAAWRPPFVSADEDVLRHLLESDICRKLFGDWDYFLEHGSKAAKEGKERFNFGEDEGTSNKAERARSRVLQSPITRTSWNRKMVESVLQDILWIFEPCNPVLASLRISLAEPDGHRSLRTYAYAAVHSMNPPPEELQQPVPDTIDDLAWKAIKDERAIIFDCNQCRGFHPIHPDSHRTKGGIMIPLRLFIASHDVEGVLTVELESAEKLRKHAVALVKLKVTSFAVAKLSFLALNNIERYTVPAYSRQHDSPLAPFVAALKGLDLLSHFFVSLDNDPMQPSAEALPNSAEPQTDRQYSFALSEFALNEFRRHGLTWLPNGNFVLPLRFGGFRVGWISGRTLRCDIQKWREGELEIGRAFHQLIEVYNRWLVFSTQSTALINLWNPTFARDPGLGGAEYWTPKSHFGAATVPETA